MLTTLRACLALCTLLATALPARADEVALVRADIGPGSKPHEYRFTGSARDVVHIAIASLAGDLDVEVGRGEGSAFRAASGYHPAQIINLSLTESGPQILRVMPPKVPHRYLIRLETPRPADLTPLDVKTLSAGPATTQRQVVGLDHGQTFEIKPTDPLDPDFAVPHHVLRIEGRPGEGVLLKVSSQNMRPGVFLRDTIRQNKFGPVEFGVPLDEAGKAEVRIVPVDFRLKGSYEVYARKDPYFVPEKKPAVVARLVASAPIASTNQTGSMSGKYADLMLRLECANDRSWAGNEAKDLGSAQPNSACGKIPFGGWVVWMPPVWYVWRTNTRKGKERLGDPTVGTVANRNAARCEACDRQHKDCLRACSVYPSDRTALCVSLCDRPRDTCHANLDCGK